MVAVARQGPALRAAGEGSVLRQVASFAAIGVLSMAA